MDELAISAPELARRLGCSKDVVYRAIRDGHLPTVRFAGRRRLIPTHGLAERIAGLATTNNTQE